MSKNERITENIVRDTLRDLGYYDTENGITVEEQKSENEVIKKLLKGGSKQGGSGSGYPEFIIQSKEVADFIILIECKADTKYHESQALDKPRDFAVDGVLHYAARLAKKFNVIAVAVSGQTTSKLKISTFLHPRESKNYKPLENKSGKKIESILPHEDFIKHGTFDPEVEKKRFSDLMAFSRDLHEFMRDHAKLTESEKPLLVSGTLIALKNKAFSKSFDYLEPAELQEEWLKTIKKEIEKAQIPHSKKNNMVQPYSSIAVHPELGKSTKSYPRGNLHELITRINDHVWPFISVYHNFDVVGQFYGEFLKYTGGDKKALGIVLTPRHITDLFCEIANVNSETKALDICCGTGGFLVAAMNHMIKDAETQDDIDRIKKKQLIGVEQQPNMFALAASNMILRGDGKANLHQGSCFDDAIQKEIMAYGCDVGLINPPYSQSDEDLHELVFVKTMLDHLKEGGIGVAIVPMGRAIAPHTVREEILKHHTLVASMSMPDELFYPVGTVTCILVFEAHKPHSKSKKKTWFGYWKTDGFVKDKVLGRVDLKASWEGIKKKWVENYRNLDEIPGECIKTYVGANDEWCAEAYMETDYQHVSEDDMKKKINEYLMFNLFTRRA